MSDADVRRVSHVTILRSHAPSHTELRKQLDAAAGAMGTRLVDEIWKEFESGAAEVFMLLEFTRHKP